MALKMEKGNLKGLVTPIKKKQFSYVWQNSIVFSVSPFGLILAEQNKLIIG